MQDKEKCPFSDGAAPGFPFKRDQQFELPNEYALARATCPVAPVTLWNGQRAWLLTRYEDYRQVLLDDRFSGEFARDDFPTVTEARKAIDKLERAFVGMDNPRHGHYRRMFMKEFTMKRMQALRPKIESLTDQLLNSMADKGPPCDLVKDLAVELPALVMCELFGSPYEDHSYILKCAAGRHGLGQSAEEAAGSASDLVDYCRNLISEKERAPTDDMLGRVIQEYVVSGQLNQEELANICSMILRAGHDTTTNMISLGTLMLLEHPDQLRLFKQDPSLDRTAVDELLRFLTPVQFAPRRVALEDVEIGGAQIRKGDGVFAISASVNRDPDQFSSPDRLDLTRNATQHMSFGFGIHSCLGQGLARVELQIVFRKLFDRFPDLHVTEPVETLPFKYDSQIYGIYRLPVAW
ncbi:MAG: cytochrome P450 [Gammaproteobacteria bacterium]|jgi:cytochrome P450